MQKAIEYKLREHKQPSLQQFENEKLIAGIRDKLAFPAGTSNILIESNYDNTKETKRNKTCIIHQHYRKLEKYKVTKWMLVALF